MDAVVRALTVQQPWAWAIIHGGKDVENRTQAWSYRGPLAIHAGARMSQRGIDSPLMHRAVGDAMRRDDSTDIHHLARFIGVVDLVDVHEARDYGEDGGCCDPWGEQSYREHGGRVRREVVHLVLRDPRPLDRPIPCRGRLGLWTPPPDTLDELRAVV